MSQAKVCSAANLWSCVLIKGLVFVLFFLQLLVVCLTHTQAVLSGVVLAGLPVPAWFSKFPTTVQRHTLGSVEILN